MFFDAGVFSPRLPEFAKENSAADLPFGVPSLAVADLPLGVPSLVLPPGACCRVGLPMLGADRRASICFELSEV